jgi:hypothetical protein
MKKEKCFQSKQAKSSINEGDNEEEDEGKAEFYLLGCNTV